MVTPFVTAVGAVVERVEIPSCLLLEPKVRRRTLARLHNSAAHLFLFDRASFLSRPRADGVSWRFQGSNGASLSGVLTVSRVPDKDRDKWRVLHAPLAL
jgi:hypothetical protein